MKTAHPTPRTDARTFDFERVSGKRSAPDGSGWYVQADFARYLERDLAKAIEAIRELNERAASHLITMMEACGKACLERDQARAAWRRAVAENERLRAQLAHTFSVS